MQAALSTRFRRHVMDKRRVLAAEDQNAVPPGERQRFP
jgi:hypothetical protein